MIPRGRAVLDRARRVPAARAAGLAVRLRRPRLLARHRHARTATCRRTSTSCERSVDDARSADELGAQYVLRRADGERGRRARGSCRPCYIARRRARRAPARAWARWPCSGAGAVVGEGATVVEAVLQAGVVVGAHAPGRAQHPGARLERGRRHAAERRRARRGLSWSAPATGSPAASACTRRPTLPGQLASSSDEQLDGRESTMTIPGGIFKAYDVRGLYPQEIDEARRRAHRLRRWRSSSARRRSARAWTRGPRRRAWSRRSPPARPPPAPSTVDYGMVPTEMLYFGVASRGLDGGARSPPRTTRRSTTA